MKFVEDAKHWWRWLSVQIQGAALALSGGWVMMPQEWKDATPKVAIVSCVALFAVATIFGRVVKQK